MSRVLHLLAPASAGGLESVVQMLSREQRADGIDTRVAGLVEPAEEEHPFFSPLIAAGVHAERLVVPHRAYWREWRVVEALLRRTRPSVVHTHGYRADVLAGTCARRRGIVTVSTLHGFTGGGPKNRFYETLQLRALRHADAVVAVSRAMVPRMLESGIPDGRLHVVQNAWAPSAPTVPRAEARQRLGADHSTFVVGWVGRLSTEKGADVAIRALGRIDADDLRLFIVGEGGERDALAALADSLGLGSRVRWLGQVAEAGRLYEGFDAFLLSSRTEGTPIVLFEAMEAGVPIVATDVGGVPDVLEAGVNALLTPSENPDAIASAIRRLRAEPELGRRLAEAARDRLADRFSRRRWVDRYQRVYRVARDAAKAGRADARGREEGE